MTREPWEFADRVALGMKELDRVRPGWVKLMDLDGLNLAVGGRCVLGQMDGTYASPLWGLWSADPFGEWAREHGLWLGPGRSEQEWDALT